MRFVLYLTIAFVCSACGLIPSFIKEGEKQPASFTSTSSSSSSTESSSAVQVSETPKAEFSDVVITWKRSVTPVDGYIIRFGSDKNALTSSVKISADAVTKNNEDTVRYALKRISKKERLFVAIESFRGDTVSPLSEVLEVPPL